MSDLGPIEVLNVVIEAHEDGFLVMDHDGQVQFRPTVAAAARCARSGAAKVVKRNGGIAVTRIEWRNMPEGFIPPE